MGGGGGGLLFYSRAEAAGPLPAMHPGHPGWPYDQWVQGQLEGDVGLELSSGVSSATPG